VVELEGRRRSLVMTDEMSASKRKRMPADDDMNLSTALTGPLGHLLDLPETLATAHVSSSELRATIKGNIGTIAQWDAQQMNELSNGTFGLESLAVDEISTTSVDVHLSQDGSTSPPTPTVDLGDEMILPALGMGLKRQKSLAPKDYLTQYEVDSERAAHLQSTVTLERLAKRWAQQAKHSHIPRLASSSRCIEVSSVGNARNENHPK